GIAYDRAVTVDASMKTSAEHVYAAGDITGLSGIWPNAADQGRIAGKSMCGLPATYTDTYAMKNNLSLNCIQEIVQADIHYLLSAKDYAASFCFSMFLPGISAA
ncbi:NAD(P)/FAD-dependent oxidoreductase, partial [Klebsiella oxytoca]